MRLLRFGSNWLMGDISGSRFLAAIEGTVIGLAIGLIDIHSANGDWFQPELAYLIAGFGLGLRHGARSWQAWCPLGWCFYLMHRVAIARGYQPPYVEADANRAIVSLFVLWPAGLGLVGGAFVRWVISRLLPPLRSISGGTNHDPARAGNRDVTRPADPDRAPSRPPAVIATERMPRRRLTVRGLMVIIALIGVHVATLRALLFSDHFFGFGTIYSEGYSEGRFRALRPGMSRGEVESIIGRPLRILTSDQHAPNAKQELWFYSDQPDATANFHRRRVLFDHGKVVMVVNDFWVD
jgi:hypothetical protein